MDGTFLTAEADWFGVLLILFWIVSSIISVLKKRSGQNTDYDDQEEWEAPPPPQRTEQVERGPRDRLAEVLRQIEQDMGLHTPERPEPAPSLGRPELHEDGVRASTDIEAWNAAQSFQIEAEKKARALRRKQMMSDKPAKLESEMDHRANLSGEHRPSRESRPARPALVASLLSDLSGEQLPKAILLQEILGPPVSLRE